MEHKLTDFDDFNPDEFLREFDKKNYPSKLNLYFNQIMFLHHHGFSARKIVFILDKKYNVQVAHSSVIRFINKNLAGTITSTTKRKVPKANKIVSDNSSAEESNANDKSADNAIKLNPIFENAFNSRTENPFKHDPLKLARIKRGNKSK